MTTTTHPAYPPMPAWFNIEAIISPEEVAEIRSLGDAMRDLARQAAVLAPRVRWACELSDQRIDANEIDNVHNIVDRALGINAIRELTLLIGYVLEPDSTISDGDQALSALRSVAGLEDDVPELADALAFISESRETRFRRH